MNVLFVCTWSAHGAGVFMHCICVGLEFYEQWLLDWIVQKVSRGILRPETRQVPCCPNSYVLVVNSIEIYRMILKNHVSFVTTMRKQHAGKSKL